MLSRAISITATAFEGKLDRGGTPYILHCITVMTGVEHLGHKVMSAAVMHDLVEDTEWSIGDLREEGFDEEVLAILEKVTHLSTDSYDEYLDKVAVCPKARAIKMADLDHNSLIHRMKGLREKDFERLAKYHRAYAFLKGIG